MMSIGLTFFKRDSIIKLINMKEVKTMKRKTNVALSIVFTILVYGLFFFMRSKLRFPTLDLYNYGWIVIAFMIASFWSLVFSVAFAEKRRILRSFASVFVVLGILASLCYMTITTSFFSFAQPGIYPLYSETTDPDDYLVFDGRFEANREYITEFVPSEIPVNAENVEYKYHYDGIRSGRFNASWSLPETDYDLLKEETLKKSGNITYEGVVTTFITSWNVTDIPAFGTNMTVEFNDETKTVSYSVRQIYSC